MTTDELIRNYPRLYHMAEVDTWDSIRKNGLLSTTALLDLFQITDVQRERIESERRPESVSITHPKYGTAVIRDQKPMSESALSKCLDGMTSTQWYKLLNRRTFFWLVSERLDTLLNARAYRNRAHCVITVDTCRLLERHAKHVTLCPINSGSTIYNPPIRNADSFYTIANYPYGERRKTRGKIGAIAELVVDYSVPDISDLAISVVHRKQDMVIKKIV